jgi:hypothetical protein
MEKTRHFITCTYASYVTYAHMNTENIHALLLFKYAGKKAKKPMSEHLHIAGMVHPGIG